MYTEYRDMFYKAQKTKVGPYYMIVADIVNSKNYPSKPRCEIQLKLIEIAKELAKNKYVIKTDDNQLGILGDALSVVTLVKNKDRMINYFKRLLKQYLPDVPFHFASAYCETLNWFEGDKKYYSGYCFSELSNAHKKNSVGHSVII